MTEHPVTSRDHWLIARKSLLAKEKELTRLREELSEARRALPWVEVHEPYVFDTTEGTANLADLFGPHSQLVVQHFMFGPDWAQGCPSCSFWSDNFDGIDVHLAHRDIAFVAVSRAPLATLQDYRARMGWRFRWVSSLGSSFNQDFGVTFTAEQRERGEVDYNYGSSFSGEEAPGVSVFARNDAGQVFHTYSTFARGLDILNGAYHLVDLTPRGRDEGELPYAQAWLRRRDEYDTP